MEEIRTNLAATEARLAEAQMEWQQMSEEVEKARNER